MASCQVKVEQGILQGKATSTHNGRQYYSFEGIPYAKPPVGPLRFRDPQPVEPWTGIRDATKPGNRCAQINPLKPSKMEGSEDCLYLNIYTPNLPQHEINKLPVLFYVHGGRYVLGYADYYRPDYWLSKDMVVVTTNYRLHIFGFLSLHTKEVPGNAGLKDTVMALRWVKDNISRFNGDPGNITVFGESAGAGTVTSFLTSKMTDGLFHKVIFESGICVSDLFMVEENVIDRAKFATSQLGSDVTEVKDIHDTLMTASSEDLCLAVCAAEMEKPTIDAFYLPVVEKKFDGVERFFEEYPYISLKGNRMKKVPILCGYSCYEGALFLQRDQDGNIMYRDDLNFFLPRYLFIEDGSNREKKIVSALHKLYFNSKPVDDSTKKEYLDFVSDAYFVRDIFIGLEIMAKHIKDLYVYRFNYAGNMNTRVMKSLGVKGACHGDILQYQFYRKNKFDESTDEDRKMVAFITEAWYNFMKTGKPSWPSQELEWQPYTKENRKMLNISNELTLVDNPELNRMIFWKKVMGERSKL
ncbi:hypothetical protein JYU34_021959 [Plutella xylostella]|uniref:Carboxylesterase type B domain-containing protein n=1 Tax=Plutella xylostella TaxID=51655 RepID=A0ABQ7PRT7_PLUXY|nr:hypothetical protein JYU34_021959 [Plutella xylostella]